MFTHTISYKNTNHMTANYVSSNHCQAGSTYMVYDIQYLREPTINKDESIKIDDYWKPKILK